MSLTWCDAPKLNAKSTPSGSNYNREWYNLIYTHNSHILTIVGVENDTCNFVSPVVSVSVVVCDLPRPLWPRRILWQTILQWLNSIIQTLIISERSIKTLENHHWKRTDIQQTNSSIETFVYYHHHHHHWITFSKDNISKGNISATT